MSRRLFPRVTVCWVAELLFLFAHLCTASAAGKAHTCREVKTAFQLRHIGPLKWVPETPATDVNLLVCKHVGPSCCTRKMEENYKLAAMRDTLQSIRSYSFELRFLLSEYATTFQDTYRYLFSFSQSHLMSLFESAFLSLATPVAPHVKSLFSDLSLFIQNTANVSVEATVQHFYDHLFALVHTRIINPDTTETNDRSECLRATRHDVNPFGHHAQVMSKELADALLAARALTQAFSIGGDVMNSTDTVPLTNECKRALLKMQYCPHCQGLTLIRPCPELCLNVMRGCLASMAELNMPWRQYVAVLEDLTHILAGEHNLELSLLRIRSHVNEAILHAQLHGARVSATVDKVCGQSTAESRSALPTSMKMISTVTEVPQPTVNQSDSPVMEKQGKLSQLRREFMKYIWRNKAYFAALPEMLCEGETVRDELTCWSGDDVVESYKGGVVGNGVHAQRQNPEVKVRGPDPNLMEAKDKLEHFIQEIQKKIPGLGHRDSWEDPGSGEESSGDCDDEDGCQGSGEVTTKSSNPGPSTEAEVVMKPPPHDAPVIKPGSRSTATPLPHLSFIILILILTLQWILK